MTASSRRRVTARDVAHQAGTSATTVSYVLNATPGQSISRETRDRVLDAVQRLGYVPHSGARALRRGHNATVLLLMPDWPLGRVLALVVDALARELEGQGLSLLFRRQRDGDSVLKTCRELNPAAIVALGPVGAADQQAVRDTGVCIVTALPTSAPRNASAASFPQEAIGRMQVEHLAFKGHRRLGWFGPRDARLQLFRDLRLDGAVRACDRLGLPELTVVDGEPTEESAAAVVRQWLSLDASVTAAAAFNDEFAGALLAGLRAEDRSAPDDLAIIGVDNDPLSKFTTPPLTTIDQSAEAIAAYLAHKVEAGLVSDASPPSAGTELLMLIERRST